MYNHRRLLINSPKLLNCGFQNGLNSWRRGVAQQSSASAAPEGEGPVPAPQDAQGVKSPVEQSSFYTFPNISSTDHSQRHKVSWAFGSPNF